MTTGVGGVTAQDSSDGVGNGGGRSRRRAASASECVVRELRAGESHVVEAVFAGLTTEQRYRRFHTGVARPTKSMLHHLSTPDGTQHVAFVALWSGRPVGLARYVLTRPGRAEVAVEVVHDRTRRGVARLLLCRLRSHAIEHGIRELEMSITGDNRPAVLLARDFGVRLVTAPGGFDGKLSLGTGSSTTTHG